jgi:cytidyltransferase-like protein
VSRARWYNPGVNKKYKVGLAVMRIQPLHIGHIYLIGEMLRQCMRAVVLIGNADDAVTEQNPFTYAERFDMIKNVFPSFVADGSLLVSGINDIPDDNLWAGHVLEKVRHDFKAKPDAYFCGRGQDKALFKAAGLPVAELSREKIKVSATEIRKGLCAGKESAFQYIHISNRKIIKDKLCKAGVIQIARHAQSVVNAGRRVRDNLNAGLSPLGKIQAVELADKFAAPPDLIIVSNALRTRLTVVPLLKKFPNIPVRVMPVQEFYFINGYRVKGTTVEERKKMLREYFKRDDANYVDGADSESFDHFIRRVKNFLSSLDRSKNTLVISHGHFINGVRIIVEKLPETVHQFAEMQYVEHAELMNI